MNDAYELPETLLLMALGIFLEARRPLLPKRSRIAFHVLGAGELTIDPWGTPVVSRSFAEDAEVIVLCDRSALFDLANGRLDPTAPEAGDVFVWSGDDRVLASWAQALSGARSWLEARIDAQKGARS